MSRIFAFFVLFLSLFLSGCGEHPSSFVGIWQSGDAGIISVQNTLKLESNGKATLHMGSRLSSKSDAYNWKVEGKSLHLITPAQADPFGGSYAGKDTIFIIVAQSENTLVLQGPTGGTFNFTRIGKP